MTPLPDLLKIFDLSGKTAFVTGSTRGLGRAMALALAGAGATVVAHSRRSSGDEIVSSITELGGKAFHVSGELADRDQVLSVVSRVKQTIGPIDVLVNNAGTTERHPPEDFPTESWDRIVELNLTSLFLLCREFGRDMIDRGRGKIINIASLLAFQGGFLVPAYAATKHGVAGLTKALANDWGPKGVQVNAIAPGYIATDLNADIRNDPVRGPQLLSRIPAGRFGDPSDLSGAVIFLASSASDYVNGTVLTADGGWMAR